MKKVHGVPFKQNDLVWLILLLFLEVAEVNYIVPGLDLSKWLNSWQIQYIVFRMFDYEGIDSRALTD